MNVAFHLNRLGHHPAVITRVGSDDRGDELLSILKSKNIDCSFVQVDHSVATGIVHANPNEHGEMSYEIVAPAAWDGIKWDDRFESLFDQNNFLVFGSLICRNALSRDTLFRLLEYAKNKVLDINLRPPHYSRELLVSLLQKANIVKLNQAELGLIAGWSSDYSNVEDQVKHVQEKFSVATLVITLGGDGALMSRDNVIARHPGYHIVVEDTVVAAMRFLPVCYRASVRKNRLKNVCRLPAPSERLLHRAKVHGRSMM